MLHFLDAEGSIVLGAFWPHFSLLYRRIPFPVIYDLIN